VLPIKAFRGTARQVLRFREFLLANQQLSEPNVNGCNPYFIAFQNEEFAGPREGGFGLFVVEQLELRDAAVVQARRRLVAVVQFLERFKGGG
jgi:hypothetical protein